CTSSDHHVLIPFHNVLCVSPPLFSFILSLILPPPTSTLFPYTTLFRSRSNCSKVLWKPNKINGQYCYYRYKWKNKCCFDYFPYFTRAPKISWLNRHEWYIYQ